MVLTKQFVCQILSDDPCLHVVIEGMSMIGYTMMKILDGPRVYPFILLSLSPSMRIESVCQLRDGCVNRQKNKNT